MQEDWEPRNILVNLKSGKKLGGMFKAIADKPRGWSPFAEDGRIHCERYDSDTNILFLRRLLKGMLDGAKFLDIDRRSLDAFDDLNQLLCNPERLGNFSTFAALLKSIELGLNDIDDQVNVKLARMSLSECARIDEAIVCLRHYCYFASTVMSVSAVESRLHSLIEQMDKDLYQKKFSRATIGQILGQITAAKKTDEDTGKLAGVVPAKHQPLLNLLNVYRVYSVHPKDEDVTAQIAESVLHLSCSLLTDVKMACQP